MAWLVDRLINREKDTYIVIAPNGEEVEFDSKTNLIIPKGDYKDSMQALDKSSQMLLEARSILNNSPYKDYKPLYFNPNPDAFGLTDYERFEKWLRITYDKPKKGAIAPWTKSEKAYYESLKDIRLRYKYLVIRSGLRSAIIDIPYDAIANVDESGNLINEEYKDIYDEVSKMADVLVHRTSFFEFEWKLSSTILGELRGGGNAAGFTSRTYQLVFLSAQLGGMGSLRWICDGQRYGSVQIGLSKDLVRYNEIYNFFRIPGTKRFENRYKKDILDEYGMIPYLDELIGVDWVMDFNRGGVIRDSMGGVYKILDKMIEDGELLDPRDLNATKATREEFIKEYRADLELIKEVQTAGFPNEWDEKQISIYVDSTILESKVMSLTPPQGYPNAPYYFTPEELKELYYAGKLDKKLNPTIPAIYRDNFPSRLRDEILEYGYKHGIKDSK